MRIKDLEAKKPVRLVELRLTRAEAQELRDDLHTLLADGGDRHGHVSSADYQTELTVWISDDQ
ncbi:MAG: hypothetical protein ACT4OS_04290 [Acidimicrobiales bacterium]